MRPVEAVTRVSVKDFGAKGDGRTNDREAIQKAFDTVSFMPNSSRVGTVHFPDGIYATDRNVRVGYDLKNHPDLSLRCRRDKDAAENTPMERRNRVALVGTGRAELRYTGPVTDDYLLYYSGQGRGFTCIDGLVLSCVGRCRGLFASHLAYQSNIRNLEIRYSRGIGLDALDCWGSVFESIMCYRFRGVGMRLHEFNSSTLRNAYFSTDKDGDSFWPDPSEDLVRSSTGTVVHVTEDHRAELIVKANCGTFSNLCFESAHYETLGPVGIYAATEFSDWNQLRFEGNDLPTAKIRLPRYTRQNLFSGILLADKSDCECVFDCGRDVAGNEFTRIGGHGNIGQVFKQDGNFFGNRIEGIGFVEDVPLGDLGEMPNHVHGVQTGRVESLVDPASVSAPVTSGYYGICSAGRPRHPLSEMR